MEESNITFASLGLSDAMLKALEQVMRQTRAYLDTLT